MKHILATITIGCVAPLGLCLAPAATGGEPAATPAQGQPPVMMEAFKVDTAYMPKLSFGISLDVWKDNNTQKVVSIFVSQVRADSEAEEKGLAPRARIERIDGKPVQEYSASFLKGTELNRIFVNRPNGAKVVLEVSTPGEPGARTLTLTEHRSLGISLPGTLERLGH